MARYCVGASMEIDWGEDEPQAKWDWCLAKRVFAYFRPYWRYGLTAIACLAAGAALGLVPAVVTKAVIDALAHPDRAFGKVMALILIGVGASLVGGLVGVAESWCSATISQRIMFDLREQLFDRLLRQSVGFFTRSRTGDVMSRIGNDVNAVEDVVADTILGMVYNLFVVPSTLVLMVVLNWRLTVLALLLMPLALLPSRRVGRITYEARKQTQTHLGRMTAYLQEILGISGILLVKAFVTGRRERARFRGLNDELRRLQLRQEMIGRWFYMLMDVLQTAGPAVLWLYGGWLVFHGQATVGTVVTDLHRGPGRAARRRDRVAGQPQRQHHRVAGAVSPHLRGAGPGPRGRRRSGCQDAGAGPRCGCLRAGHLHLRAGPAPRPP